MLRIERNTFVSEPWVLTKVVDRAVCDSFDCGNRDLNDYFHNDAVLYKQLLLTESYYLHTIDRTDIAVALLDFCNDSINLEGLRGRIPVPHGKPQKYWPAVKLTRLGVATELQGQNIGTNILNMIKMIFITDNRTGCRFLTVDALNKKRVLNFYQTNGFLPYTDDDIPKRTRLLFYDLTRRPSVS
jgi:GNAT superfamily N-acetyltransferase